MKFFRFLLIIVCIAVLFVALLFVTKYVGYKMGWGEPVATCNRVPGPSQSLESILKEEFTGSLRRILFGEKCENYVY